MAFAAVSPQDRKLNSELKVKFQRLHETLAKENLLPVIDHLFAEGVISGEVEYKLRLMPNKIEQSRELLSILHATHNPLAFVKVHEAMMAEKAYKHIIEQIDELKVGMAEPISGTAVSEHSSLPELNDYIRGIFPKITHDELHHLTDHLRSLGVDEVEELGMLEESDLTGHVKPIRMRKLLDAAKRMKQSNQSRTISQKETEEQQLAETTSTTVVQKQTEEERKVKESVHEQRTRTANKEIKVNEHQQMGQSQSRAVPQKQKDEQQSAAAAKPTSQISFPKKKEDLVHDKPTANNESNVREYQQMVPRVVLTLPATGKVNGVTSLDDELYVLHNKLDKEQVEVYNTTTTQEEYSLVRRLSVRGAGYLCDIVSCKHYRCLYIADWSSNYCVYKVELNGKVTKLSVNNKPHSLSVTSQFTVLNTSNEDSKLIELTTEGEQLRVINIGLQINFVSLQHAIQLSNGQFVVSHGGSYDPMDRVCIVDTNGHVTQSYGGPRGSATVGQLGLPCHLAVDKDEFIFVADYHNSRVLLVSPTLSFVREIVSRDQLKGEPERLFLDVDRRRLFVTVVDNGVVVVQL